MSFSLAGARFWMARALGLCRRGLASLERAMEASRAGRPIGSYVLQAQIAACHARAATAEDTDWRAIAAWYDVLAQVGDNPVVDRRAIVFAGEKKKKVKDDKPADDKKDEKKDEPAQQDAKPEGDGSGEAKPADPPAVPPKQGGCGCRTAGDDAPAGGALAALGLAMAVIARRKR